MQQHNEKFHLILSLDYELFGDGSGCLEHCVAGPTARCAAIAEDFDGRLSLFVEALEFEQIMATDAKFNIIADQLNTLSTKGHEFALHLHPQWSDARSLPDGWQLDFSQWRIGDLKESEVPELIARGHQFVSKWLQPESQIKTFRAGGWCIQPSETLVSQLSETGIVMESTVAPGTWNLASGDWFNFRHTPTKPFWRISTDVCTEDLRGSVLEIPIATQKIGKLAHARALIESRQSEPFPEDCHGTYNGPNNRFQSMLGKASKVLSLGNAMLDFSSLPSDYLIRITSDYMQRYESWDGPVPVVAISHNKNFTKRSEAALRRYLEWVNQSPNLIISSYDQWHQAHRRHVAAE